VVEHEGESWGAERALSQIEDHLSLLRAGLPTLRTDADFADHLQQTEALRQELLRHSGRTTAGDQGQRDRLLASVEAHVDQVMQRLQAQA